MSFPIVQKNQLHCKQGAVRAVRFNVDGNYCMTAGADKSVKLWNPYKQSLLQTYMGHGYEVLDVQSSADSSHIASAGMDKCVFYWDVSTAQIVRKYRGHASKNGVPGCNSNYNTQVKVSTFMFPVDAQIKEKLNRAYVGGFFKLTKSSKRRCYAKTC